MVGVVERIEPRGEQFNRLANAAWLVDAALLADRQVHREVQKSAGFIGRGLRRLLRDGGQRSVNVGQHSVVFRVFVDPQTGDGLDRLHRLLRQRTEVKAAAVERLAGMELVTGITRCPFRRP